ncbi:histidine kinase [Microbacter sp. GSS18]|nr:histidine kinase [Microbacter sp. GSS18]
MDAHVSDGAVPAPGGDGRRGGGVRLGVLWSLLALAAAAWAAVVFSSVVIEPRPERLTWSVIAVSSLLAAVIILARLPRHPLAPWLVGSAMYNFYDLALDGLDVAAAVPGNETAVALWNLLVQESGIVPPVCLAVVIALFPDGRIRHRYERRVLRLIWLSVLVPPALLLLCSEIPLPTYKDYGGPIANPFALGGGVLDGWTGSVLADVFTTVAVIAGTVLLIIRYAKADAVERRPMRWLFVPISFIPVAAVSLIVSLSTGDFLLVTISYLLVTVSFFAAIVIGILQPRGLSADRAIRRSLLYGVMWAAIAAAFVAVGAVIGVAAGTLLPLDWAIVLAMVAALAFQPVRARLQALADRWIFGRRADPRELVERLGEALAGTDDLDALLPRMTATLEQGLGLEWARIDLEPLMGDVLPGEPSLRVPIEVEGEHIGEMVCGPKRQGELRAEDRTLVETFARQAGMAVRNVRLKDALAAQAGLLRESQSRLVKAQEAERRRIERNIHDGVQQDLTALIGIAGHAREEYDRSPGETGDDLAMLQDGLRRVLADVRALAQGIHPSVLTDRGLLAAVEALAARHPVPVSVRAGRDLLRLRLPEELEGAAYFTVAEALANSLKHAHASHIEVELAREDGVLRVRASDDGVGLAPASPNGGNGLAHLAARVAAVGGRLEVTGSAGEGTIVAAEFALEGVPA